MINVRKIDHISLICPDLEKSEAFYTRFFGFKVVERSHVESQKIDMLVLEGSEGGALLELIHFTDGRHYNYADGYYELLSLRVDDVFAAAAALKAAGVHTDMDEPVEMSPGEYFFFFRGPAGERLEIIQRKN